MNANGAAGYSLQHVCLSVRRTLRSSSVLRVWVVVLFARCPKWCGLWLGVWPSCSGGSVMQSGERGSKVGRVSGPEKASTWMFCGPQLRRDHPPNLSILISGGRETNWDSPSSGERSGKSSSMQSLAMLPANCGHQRHLSSRLCCSKVDLERYAREGDSPVLGVVGCDIGCLHRVGLFGTAAQSWW